MLRKFQFLGNSRCWRVKNSFIYRYIPNTSSQIMGNTCVGTKFLASKDNKYFVELGTVNPDVNGDINLVGIHLSSAVMENTDILKLTSRMRLLEKLNG